jgi:thioesterase domain-containing protein/acyl carrier protein
MPLFHIHGLIGATLSSMVAGASIVCTPGFDASKFFDWLDEFQPTWYTAVPTVHQAVLGRVLDNQDRVTRSRLRLIRSSSSALPPQVMAELERVFNAPAIESYGMTEASHQMTSNPLPPGQRKPGSVGVPAGPEVAIMDEPGNRLSPGQVGEIVIRGANVMHGYENNPSANESSFTNGWFRTGDQGYFDTDGYLFIQGRIKEIINRGGEKIAPREVDEVLMDHPAVVQAVTFAVPHPTLGEDVATAVILQAGVTTTEKELRELAFARLADYKVPSQVVIVDEIPKGPTGKLQRIGLADKLASKLKAEYVAPRNSVEETLTQLWAETLDVERVGVYDNFFGLGGDSLLAARLFAQIEQHFGKKLPLATLFQTPTVEQLAGVLTDEAWSAPWSSLVPIQPLGSRPPFFFVHAHGGNVVGYYDLARHLGPDQPFYGLQAQGLSEERVTPRRFEDMAAHYITEIRTVQPHGPYFLGGYCLGGDVAFEMAHQLRAQGEEVALLAMVQNPHPDYPRFRPGVTPLHILIYRALERIDLEISNFQEVKREAKWLHLLGRVKRLITLVQGGTETMIEALLARVHLQIPHSRTYILYALEKSHRMAYEDYQLRPYQGPVTLFRANKQPLGIYRDPTLGWDRLIEGQLECYEVPGHRIGMLSEPRVRILAEQLRACIDKAQRRYR